MTTDEQPRITLGVMMLWIANVAVWLVSLKAIVDNWHLFYP